jgi:hypothetical protein
VRGREGLAGKLAVDQHFWPRDALTVTDWPQVGQHAVALHACGELHRRLIQQGVQVGACRFDVAPCCYYRGVETAYRPLDQDGVTLQLTRDDTRLAVTEMVTASPRQARQRDQGMAWKLAFAHWRQMVTGEAYQRFKPVPPAWLRGGFGDFWPGCVSAKVCPWRQGAAWWRSRQPVGSGNARSCACPSPATPSGVPWKSGWCSIWRVTWRGAGTPSISACSVGAS